MNNYNMTQLNVPAPGGDLYGELYIPNDNKNTHPLIIVCHGMYYSYTMTQASCKTLAEKGYASYCFDFHGCSYTNASGGDLTKASIMTEKSEVEACIDYFKSQEYVDSDKIVILGQSLGGVVCSLAAIDRKADLAGLILMYPAYMTFDVINNMFPERDKVPEIVKDALGIPGIDYGRIFYTDIIDCDFDNIVDHNFKKPVLLLHGDKDSQVPMEYIEKASKMFDDVTTIIEPGKEHGYQLDDTDIDYVVDYLNKLFA